MTTRATMMHDSDAKECLCVSNTGVLYVSAGYCFADLPSNKAKQIAVSSEETVSVEYPGSSRIWMT